MLRAEELRVRDARGLLAVDGATFEVRAGEVLGVAGVQGNGQSELVEALVGLRPLAGGRLAARALARARPAREPSGRVGRRTFPRTASGTGWCYRSRWPRT